MSQNEPHPIDCGRILEFFDADFRLVREHEFRRAIFKEGISDEVREIVWKFLFQFYPLNSTKRERSIKDTEKYVEYFIMKNKWLQIVEKNAYQPDFNLKITLNDDQYETGEKDQTSNNENLTNFQESTSDLINVDSVKIQTILKISRINVSESRLKEDIKQIDKDLQRTKYLAELLDDPKKKESHTNALRNLLITFAAFNQTMTFDNKEVDLGYSQGMDELASVFISAFKHESQAYWCFSNFMLVDVYSNSSLTLNTTSLDETHVLKTNVAHYFCSLGMWKKLNHLSYLLSVTDAEVYARLEKHNIKNLVFCHEWLLLNFKRCFNSTRDFLHCFELLNCHFVELHTSALKSINVKNLYTFDLFVCLSLLKQMRRQFLDSCNEETDFMEVYFNFNRSNYLANNFKSIINDAEQIFDQYCVISHNVDMNQLNDNKQTALEKLRQFFMFN